MMEGPCSDEDWRTKSRAAPPNRHGLVISRGKASAQQSWTEDKSTNSQHYPPPMIA